jgi:hypothetical protein
MQAMQTTKPRVLPKRIGIALLACSVLANLTLGAVALDQAGQLPAIGSHQRQQVVARAYSQPRMGEGRTSFALPSAAPRVTQHTNPFLGDGRVNVHATGLSSRPALKAYASVGQGEGWLTLSTQAARRAAGLNPSAECGQGEGLLDLSATHSNPCPTR